MNIEKDRKQALEWFVEFANMNLEEISPGDRAKLLVESQDHLFPKKEMDQFRGQMDRSGNPVLGRAIRDTVLKGSFLWAFDKYRDTRHQDAIWDEVLRSQKEVKTLFAEELLQSEYLENKSGALGRIDSIKTDIYFFWTHHGTKFELSFLPAPNSQVSYLQIRLWRLLDGLPRSIIQRCPECEKFFLNMTERKKRFCSSRCLWRSNAEKRREDLRKHPAKYKAYLKKQKEIMSKRYEEKRKAELGPNVKVKRRKEG